MSKSVIIGCKTLENELLCAMKAAGCAFPVHWIESGLHTTPKKLTVAIQEYLDTIECQWLFLAMGFCGNALQGLQTGDYQTIVPRVDDCISLLLGSVSNRMRVSKEKATYFLTKGWLAWERNIWVEYKYTIDKYGEETGREIFDMMFHEYKRLGVLNTGCYDMNDILDETKDIAKALELEHVVMDADIDYLVQLLRGPWPDERFLIIPPCTQIASADLYIQ